MDYYFGSDVRISRVVFLLESAESERRFQCLQRMRTALYKISCAHSSG